MHKLNSVESLRAQLLLENALKKLQFLSYLGSGAAGDELSVFMGGEISRILAQQKGLEKEYESLIGQRVSLRGLMHKKAYQTVQLEIQDVAHK